MAVTENFNDKRMVKPLQTIWLKRLFVLMGAVVMLLAYGIYDYFSGEVEFALQENLRVIAQEKKVLLESFLQERRQVAEFLSRLAPVWQSLEQSPGPLKPDQLLSRLDTQIHQIATIYGYQDVRVYDLALKPVMTLTNRTTSPFEKTVLGEVIRTETAQLVDFHLNEDGRLGFGIASPVFRNGVAGTALIGVTYLEMDAQSRINAVISGWQGSSRSSEVVLFEADGEEVVYLNTPRFADANMPLAFRRSMRDPELLASKLIRSGKPGYLEGNDYRGIHVIGAGVQIADTPWFLVAKMDHSEANDPAQELAGGIGAVVALMLLMIGAWFRQTLRAREAEHKAIQTAIDARYAATRQVAMDAYVVIGEIGEVLECNEVTAQLTGYHQDDLRGMHLADLEASLSPVQIAAALSDLREKGGGRFQTRWYRKDGSLLHLEINVTYLKDEGSRGVFHAFMHDKGPELAHVQRIERLSLFYRFLSHVNEKIYDIDSIEQILNAVCETATPDGGFKLAWGGLIDEAGARIVPAAVSGAAIDYVDGLVITLDPVLPTSRGPAARCLREKKIIHVDDFQSDRRVQVWRDLGEQFGIRSSAAVPLVVDGKGLGCLNFYSGEKGFFDEELRGLLEEVGRNVSLAVRSVQARAEKAEAIARREEVELRIGLAIEASPIPIQIYSLSTRKLLLMNKAHQRAFGYSMEEISDDADFFNKVNVESGHGEVMYREWQKSVEDAVRGGPDFVATSPEIRMRSKDGTVHFGRAHVSVVDDEIIVQWLDLTEIRKAEAGLVENERHFRGMIEQSLTGIFVIQDSKVVYVNPRLTEITGWSAEDMLGRDFLEVICNTPGSRQKILGWFSRLATGERNIDESIPYLCRDGREIVLGIHGNQGIWEGRLAAVVMCQDITERQRAEEKIANYVKQLEGSMKGTLQAVANMVDLRDPYTAGHERRVGLVAADLAREMGWSEERCRNLELIGLVHDIGKIAVPAEILSKPTKLTKLEFEMVKIHAEKGYEILKDVEFPLPIAEIIREHHERLDGSGYPQGLKGDAILPEARVLAVADVLESMASHRPYRPALGIEVAIKEIEGHRGVWFDEAVVDAMLRLVREKGYELPA